MSVVGGGVAAGVRVSVVGGGVTACVVMSVVRGEAVAGKVAPGVEIVGAAVDIV